METFYKDPDEVKDYHFDWGTLRLEEGETLTSSEYLVEDGLVNENDLYSDTTSTAWISGGAVGSRYRVTNRVTTSLGRTYDWTVEIRVKPL